VAPLKPAEDAMLLDNSEHTVDQSVAVVMGWWAQRAPAFVTDAPT
jgi:3-phosphoshikimate 1-carboxyvinyltransferase